MNEMIPQKLKCALLSPLFIFSVGLMVLNDHVLKGSGILPHLMTGKLSDFAFLFFVPILVAYIFRVKSTIGLGISYLAVGLSFAAINVSATFSWMVETLFNSVHMPLSLWPDSTDLTALVMLPVSVIYLMGRSPFKHVQPARYLQFVAALGCLITCVATSPAMRPTHEPIYTSWEEFRSSVKVLPPREIKKRGKIYIKDNFLYVNEPNKGIHVFDNTKPENPISICFLKIPGNTDISIKGSFLYADSYVDLLVFALTVYPEDIVLVNRINDVFPYNPHQNHSMLESDAAMRGFYVMPSHVDQNKGIVTGWRPINGR